MNEREKIIRLWFDMWLQKKDLGISEMFADNSVYIESWGPEYHGSEKIKLWFDEWNTRGTVLQWDIKQFFHKENMKDGLISKEDYMDIKAQYDERITSQKQAYDQAQKEIDMYLDDNSKPHQWIQDFMEHRNITELTRMVAVECIDEIAIYEDRKIEVSFTHWQDYSALSEQVREYYQENHKEVV